MNNVEQEDGSWAFNSFHLGLFESLKEREQYKKLLFEGKIPLSEGICFLYGEANDTALKYSANLESHLDTITSFMFSFRKSMKLNEAQQLNNLGIAEKILQDPINFYKQNTRAPVNSQDEEEAKTIVEKIKMNPNYSYIGEDNSASNAQIHKIGKVMLREYAGFNIYGKRVHSALEWAHKSGNRENFRSLQYVANQKIKKNAVPLILEEKQFPYAAEFLEKHVFGPATEFFKSLDLNDPAYVLYTNLQLYRISNDAYAGNPSLL